MFNDYESSGKHMICDFKNIKNHVLLNDCHQLKTLLQKICNDNDFQILQCMVHEFDPIGCSILFLLSESHLSIHTFPEKNHMSFDIYTCRQFDDNSVYNNIFHFLTNKLEASNSTIKIIDRFF